MHRARAQRPRFGAEDWGEGGGSLHAAPSMAHTLPQVNGFTLHDLNFTVGSFHVTPNGTLSHLSGVLPSCREKPNIDDPTSGKN